MSLKEDQINVINLLIECEKSVAELYRIYADKFQEYSDFWMSLSKEELEHARWLMQLKEKIEEGGVYFNEKRFTEEAINKSLGYIKEQISEAKGELLLIKALSVAYYLEISLIENKYFEVFEGDSIELKNTLMKLSKETKIHQSKIKGFLEKEREKNNKELA